MQIVRIIALLGSLSASALQAGPVPVQNPGFENGKTGWTDDKSNSQVTAEAANKGGGGLRVVDLNEVDYVRVVSDPIPVSPGKTYKLECMVNQVSGHGVNAILWFLDKDGEIIPWPDGSRLLIRPADGVKGWEKLSVTGIAPAGSVSAQIHVQSNRIAIATVDFDEFQLQQVD